METIIIDAGPLVAYLDKSEQHHDWVSSLLKELSEPMLTCDAVLVEAAFVLGRKGLAPEKTFSLLTEELVTPRFEMAQHRQELMALLRSYRDVPISLTDACLIRVSELHRASVVFTLDRDFLVYRRNGRQRIPLLAPFA